MDEKISQLPVKTTLNDNDLIPLVDSQASPEATSQITYANVKEALAGDPGPPGTPGTVFNWIGAWATSTAYAVNDCINYNGSGYVCINAHTSGTFATDLGNGDWSLFVQVGATGPTGPQGVQGPAGLNAPVIYGTSSTPPSGQADGTIYVTYVP